MLFSSGEEGQKELASLNRNELIALVNTAAQLAKSVGSVPEWRWLGEEEKEPGWGGVRKSERGRARRLDGVKLIWCRIRYGTWYGTERYGGDSDHGVPEGTV